MKEIVLNQHRNIEHGIKHFSILQKTDEEDCSTRVYKSFRYQLDPEPVMEQPEQKPDIFITKNFDSKRGIERFTFTVVGLFYVEYNRRVYKVNFQHTLKIQLKWKNIFSPKKSEILT